MSRALLTLISGADRQKAKHWIDKAPPLTRVEFKAHKRSTNQNSKMWAMLTEVAEQATHNGQRYTPDQWKILFMYACGREVQFLPGLDGKTFLPWGQSTSDLSKDEMTDLIEFIHAWGAENGVVFHDPDAPQDNQDARGSASGHGDPRETETLSGEVLGEDEQHSEATPSAASDMSEEAAAIPADPDNEDGGETPPAPSPSSPDLIECAHKLLGISIDEKCTPLERRNVLTKAKDEWKKVLPEEDHDKLRAIFQSADAIIKEDADYDGAVSYFADMLGCTEDDIRKGPGV